MLKITKIMFLLSFLLPAIAVGKSDDWDELKGKHFIVSHRQNAVFAAEILRSAEIYYDSIVKQLGFKRLDGFWLWERRVRIRTFRSHSDFSKATGAPDWAVAKANLRTRTLDVCGHGSGLLKRRLPHEMAHLIFREYIGFEGQVPLWLDEGVAQWCEATVTRESLPVLQKWIPLKSLTNMDVRTIDDTRMVHLFYSQSASLVQYLIEQHGRPAFTKFCRQLRGGKSLDGALRFTYSRSVPNMLALERQWSIWQAGTK